MTITTFGRAAAAGEADPASPVRAPSVGRSTRRKPNRSCSPDGRSNVEAWSRHPLDIGTRDRCATMAAATRLGDSMFERLFGGREVDPAVAERIPPGQYKTDKFPVLHYGSVPRTDLATWDFKVFGEVDNPFTLTWTQFQAL